MASTFRSFAKLNLHLEVVARRADGYHDLRTVFQTVDLHDEVRLERTSRPGVALEIRGAGLPTDERNLAHRAASAFLARRGGVRDGVRIEIDKRLPVAAGLGGGSSNAATVLEGLATLWGLPRGDEGVAGELLGAARALGADVPFFLIGGTALGTGRGDELRPLPDPTPSPGTSLWLACPPFGLSTREVFERVAPRGPARPPPALERALAGRPFGLEELVGENDLEGPAFELRPELGALYTSLVRAGAKRVRMSGSGSALFALFDDSAEARAAGGLLPSGSNWMQVSALGRAAWRRAAGFDPLAGG